jgi:NAD(P)-dependent dehydrogenase (short-subunit alcohol dehydrogenase family)
VTDDGSWIERSTSDRDCGKPRIGPCHGPFLGARRRIGGDECPQRRPAAEAAKAITHEFGVEATPVAADFNTTKGASILDAAGGSTDILVNNPGVRQVPTPYDEISADDWRYWLEVHFLSSVQMMQAVAPGMKARGFGRIVNMSVSFIKFPQVGFAHSHAARLALSGASAAMVRELIGHNVTINTVCPGLFDTDALHTNLHGHAKRGNTTYEAIVKTAKTTARRALCRSFRMRRPHCLSLLGTGGLHVGPEHRQ